MAAARKKIAVGPSQQVSELSRLARQTLAENGEQPAHWIIIGHESLTKTRLFCSSPPFAVAPKTGPLLAMAQANSLNLGLGLTIEPAKIEVMIWASYGFLGNLLGEGSHDAEDFPTEYVEIVYSQKPDQPAVALRTAIREMIGRGYARLSHLATRPTIFSNGGEKLALTVRLDGGLKVGDFEAGATLGQLSEAMAGIAAKAKLVRMRQGAQNCGGCGRCCHDPDIPLTYFDVESVAAHRFPDLYQAEPAAALSQTHNLMAFPKATRPDSLLPAARLYFRKRDGSGGAGSPCVFLDGKGLCGVYAGRPLLCRLYHCAEPSVALEHLYKTAFYALEWLGRVVESGLFQPARPLTLTDLLDQPLIKLASPYALLKVAEEISRSGNS